MFYQSPVVHLTGSGCPGCGSYYSSISIRWLNSVQVTTDARIQHAEAGGEYRLPNTKYKVDGFCKETNTVYEFHGDIYHGNLNVYAEDELCNPFTDLTAKELNQKTKLRENEIKELGYNLVVMWENDFRKIEKAK